MIATTFLSILALIFWSTIATSQELQLNSTTTLVAHVVSDDYPTPTSIVPDDGLAKFSHDLADANHPISGSSGAILPEKDIRLVCSKLSLYPSNERPGIYYITGTCGGVWEEFSANRCSYLDLDLCFANIDGKLKPGRLGLFSSACRDCSYYTTKGDNMLKCKCYAGRDQDNLIESTVNLDETLTANNGFLSCYGLTNFECPPPGDAPV